MGSGAQPGRRQRQQHAGLSAIKGNVTAIISNNDSYQIRYTTVDANNNWTERTVNVVFPSADGSQSLKIGDKTFNLVGTSQNGKTLLDYSGYATGVTVDLSGPTASGNGEARRRRRRPDSATCGRSAR